MRHFDDITPALQAILRSWSTGDTACWVSFVVPAEKLDGIDAKFTEVYGTRLSAEKRRWRRNKGLPTAWSASMPVLGNPYKREIILMASREAMSMQDTPWAREKWLTRPPEASDFVLVREPRDRGDYAWTWRIQDRAFGLVEQHLIGLVKAGDPQAFEYSRYLVRLYPLFGGVRRQLRRLIKSAAKLWVATRKTPWGGQDPEAIPAMVGFRKETADRRKRRSAPPLET